jgi:hypothetical protein
MMAPVGIDTKGRPLTQRGIVDKKPVESLISDRYSESTKHQTLHNRSDLDSDEALHVFLDFDAGV